MSLQLPRIRNSLRVFPGTSNPELGRRICEYLQIAPGRTSVTEFADGELFVQVEENVRGADVFVVQPTCRPANRNIMELLLLLDALKRASAARITAVVPYFGYARQDRKDRPRVPISAKLVADLITAAGAHRVLAMDLHASQIQAYFNVPVDHLYAAPVMLDYLRSLELASPCVVSPDAGGVERARAFAKRIHANLAIVDKRRPTANVAVVMNLVGDVDDMDALIADDIVDTAGTLVETARALKNNGARRVLACCTHGVLSHPAQHRIIESEIDELIITDTIPQPDQLLPEFAAKFTVLSVANLLGEAIRRIHEETSVSSLFV